MLFLSKRKFYIRFRRRGIWNWVYCWISKASCWNHIYLFSWFGCSDHHPNALSSPFSSLSLSLSLSLCTSALSQILISQTLDSLKLQKNPQFHNHPSLSLSLSLFLCACSRSSLQSSECVCSLCFFRSFSLSIFLVLAQVSRPDDRSIPDMAEGKLDLPDDLLSSKPSDHSWSAKGTTYYHYFTTLFSLFTSFFCFQCLSVLFIFSRFAYVFDGFDRCGFDARFRALLIWNHL